jgi:uncharacterized protein (TIGR03663 family)
VTQTPESTDATPAHLPAQSGFGGSSRLRIALSSCRLEHLIWVAILIMASFSRLWDLGSRALHHDESLHTYYSWVFSEGMGYVHHPMMHGPFLFHINALSYLLFGDSDYTSRLTAAFFGIVLVMLPWLLRGPAFLGRWGAISASILILVSPSILYYSRFIRHDIFAIVGALLLFIAVVRYLERPASRWIILAVASVGFVLTTHEITFVNLALLAAFTGALIAWRVLPAALLLVPGAVVAFLVTRWVLIAAGVGSVPEIPWQEPSTGQVVDYLMRTLIHPVIAAGVAIALATIISIAWMLERKRPAGSTWIDGTLGRAEPDSTAGRFATSLRDRWAWAVGAAIGGSIFVVLYTSLFNNMGGLGSGTFGAVGYWLGQHDVQRGEQPWFYYIVLAPQYEFLAITGSFAVGIYLITYVWKRRRENLESDRRFISLALLAWWAIVMFLVLSWAGEKMPWLIVHFLLPMLLLTGGGVGLAIEWIEKQPVAIRARTGSLLGFIGIPVAVLVTCWFMLMNWATNGPFRPPDSPIQRPVPEGIPSSWWIVAIPLAAAIVLTITTGYARGWRPAFLASGAVAGCLLLLLQINAGWNLSFREGDVPKDMLVYVQTSPDLHQTVNDLETLSHELTGGMELNVYYSGITQWPLNWYFRDFNQRVLFHDVHDIPDAPVIIIGSNEIGETEEQRLQDYSYIEFPLRWWIPEDQTYRRFAIAPEVRTEWRQNLQTDDPPPYSLADVAQSLSRTAGSIRHEEQQASLFRLIVHRELSAPIGAFSMRVYVHDDYVRDFNGVRYADWSSHERGDALPIAH